MTRPEPVSAPAPDTVFFLSDYGLRDEFVGVVHAVLARLAPHARVIDLTHDIAPFDVRAGAGALVRVLPHLGPGVVLAVVDPGVGGGRRALALASGPGPGPRFFVGPDNGLLVPALESTGDVTKAVALAPAPVAGATVGPVTFDGRDVFAPAAAALCLGADPGSLGDPVVATSLVRVPAAVCEAGTLADGRHLLRAEITWVDRFGNGQLAAPAVEIPDHVAEVEVRLENNPPGVAGDLGAWRRVRSYTELAEGEPGVLGDGNGRLALVVRQGSAQLRFGVDAGGLVQLVW